MLADELSGRRYIKAEHNRALQQKLGRSRGSIEFKYANISAAAKAFGQPILRGYLPRFNFQMALAEAIERWLTANPEWTQRLPTAAAMRDPTTVFMTTPPTLRNTPPPDELEQMQAIARKFDVAARDERNRSLGRAGEKLVLDLEREHLRSVDRNDLAERVRWTSEEDGDGAGYDIASFTADGQDRLIEVKTTTGWERTPFYISRNELAVAEERRESWYLFRLYDFARSPSAFELRPPLDSHVDLTATSFQASFH